jgi:hypothetical protein
VAEKTSVINRVKNIYYKEEGYLKDTDAGKAALTYLGIESPERSDLLTLRTAISKYLDSIPSDSSILNPLDLSGSVNKLLEVVEAEFVGDTALTGLTLLKVETKAQDSITEELSSINSALEVAVGKDGLTDVTMLGVKTSAASSLSAGSSAVNSALEVAVGKDGLTDVTMLGVKTSAASSLSAGSSAVNSALEVAVGKDGLTDVTMLGVKTSAASSLSAGSSAVNSALEVAVGKDALTDMTFLEVVTKATTSLSGQIANVITAVGTALTSLHDRVAVIEKTLDGVKIGPETAVTVTGCTKSGGSFTVDEKPIYTSSNDFAQAIANGFKCDTFVASAATEKDLYITITGKAEDCSYLLSGKDAASACKMYQDVDWADA